MKKNIIKLTEKDFHNIIKESIKKILSESFYYQDDDYIDNNDAMDYADAEYDKMMDDYYGIKYDNDELDDESKYPF